MSDINEFTFWKAACVQNPKNCTYPTKVLVTDADSFNEMAHFDHVTAEYEIKRQQASRSPLSRFLEGRQGN